MMRVIVMLGTVCSWIAASHAQEPLFCELYAPGHFGNWYEVAGQREMRDMLAQAKAWGYTRYGDWFDMLDCADPFRADNEYDLGDALWERKKTNFRTAQSLGLQTDLIVTPNHVYTNQLDSAWRAKTGPRIIGQLICPTHPDARKAILDDYSRLFADLANEGVHLTAITAGPYDYGGCLCERCHPWIVTFAELVCEIHVIARQYHPGIELHFIGWWWSPAEHQQFARWMDAHAPDKTASISLHIPYGGTRVPDVTLPAGCKRYAFAHIGYGEQDQPRDVYGLTGPVIAADRLTQTVRALKEQGVTGVVVYSEGIFDDLNKALLAGLWSGRYGSSHDILTAYARRYFDADDVQAQAWADWLAPWGRPFDRDAVAALKFLDDLSGEPTCWRRQQWALKAEMFAAHQAIGTGDAWTAERLAQAERFWSAREKLNRNVYGLGLLRHILAARYVRLPWCDSWRQQRKQAATRAE